MKLTEKTMGNIMGKINKFLSKPTKRYMGKKTKVNLDENGNYLNEESIDIYVPYVGECCIHPYKLELEKIMKDGGYISERDKNITKETLLFLRNKYSSAGIPLMVNFDVKITGNCMIIKQNNIFMDITNKKYPFRKKSEYLYFYHMESNDEDIAKNIRTYIGEMISEMDESIYDEYIDSNDRTYFIDITQSCYHIVDCIKTEELISSDIIEKKLDLDYIPYDSNNIKVFLCFKPKQILENPSDECVYFKVIRRGSNSKDIFHSIMEVIKNINPLLMNNTEIDDFDYMDFDLDLD